MGEETEWEGPIEWGLRREWTFWSKRSGEMWDGIWETMQPLLSVQLMLIVFLPSAGASGKRNTGQLGNGPLEA